MKKRQHKKNLKKLLKIKLKARQAFTAIHFATKAVKTALGALPLTFLPMAARNAATLAQINHQIMAIRLAIITLDHKNPFESPSFLLPINKASFPVPSLIKDSLLDSDLDLSPKPLKPHK